MLTARNIAKGVVCSLHFINNIVYSTTGRLAHGGVLGVDGVWANNLWFDPRGRGERLFGDFGWDDWVRSGKETGGRFADPLFCDVANSDFRLKTDSPAFAIGFKPISLDGVGPRTESQKGERR